jgi:predicted outer membrane repeat protein
VYNIYIPVFHIVLTNGTLNIDNSQNTTIRILGSPGAAVDDKSNGDEIFDVLTPAYVQNLIIENGGNDNADLDGAGMYVYAATGLSRVQFLNNNAGTAGSGGAIYTDSGESSGETVLSISSSLFKGNRAHSGGAIYNDSSYTSIQGTTFTGNAACSNDPCGTTSSGSGGAIYNSSNQLTLNLSILTNNQAGSLAEESGDGGAVYNTDFMQMNNNQILNNVAGDEGGGVYNDDDLSMNNNTVSANTSGSSGGGVSNEDFIWINGGTFTGNVTGGSVSDADGSGGGLYINYWATVSNASFQGNKSLSSNGTIQPDTVKPESVKPRIVADTCGGAGGGIYNNDHTTLTNDSFVQNQACDGGGIYTYDSSYPLNINSSRFMSNMAAFDGGALYVSGSPAQTILHDSQVVVNRAGDQTGGVWNDTEGDVVFTGSTTVLGNTGGVCPNVLNPCS